MMVPVGKALICLGLALVAVGALLVFSGRFPFLGRLPGDIAIHKPGFSFYFPVTTSLLLSVLLSLVLWLFRR